MTSTNTLTVMVVLIQVATNLQVNVECITLTIRKEIN